MILIFILNLFMTLTYASEEIIEGSIKFELRQFEDDENSETFQNQSSILGEINFERQFDETQMRFSVSGRYDNQDSARTHLWPKDIYISSQFQKEYKIRFGFKIFDLSNMEAFNPLDVINARIFDVSVINAEKMGEFSIGGEAEFWNGNFSFYFLPHPTRPELPGSESRLNLTKDLNESVWLGENDNQSNWRDHFFLMYEKSFDKYDAQVVIHKGMDRTRAVIGTDNFVMSGNTAIPKTFDLFTPYYYERHLTGTSIVYNFDEFQVKSVFTYSNYLSDQDIFTFQGIDAPVNHTTAVLGVEKVKSHDNNWESTLIFEYQYQWLEDDEFRDNFTLQNDIFLAWKISFNDLNSRELTISFMRDMEGANEGFSQVSYAQRLFEDYKLEMGGLNYEVPRDSNSSSYGIYKNAKHIYLNLIYYM
jgi:hypothetical protein